MQVSEKFILQVMLGIILGGLFAIGVESYNKAQVEIAKAQKCVCK